MTSKPEAAEEAGRTSRRRFLSVLSAASGLFGALVLAVPAIGFILAPLFKRTQGAWRDVGRVDDFEIGQIVEIKIEDVSTVPWSGVTARTGAWLHRRTEADFTVFSLNCTHLGCPVRWEPGAQLFMCPCHGGVYYIDGTPAAGPPPKPLSRYPVRVSGGKVQVQTSPIPLA